MQFLHSVLFSFETKQLYVNIILGDQIMANSNDKNKKLRITYYFIFACSLVAIGASCNYFYSAYKTNLELKETMENIIKSHEQSESLSGDSSYTEYFLQDESVDTLLDGKVIVTFPSA